MLPLLLRTFSLVRLILKTWFSPSISSYFITLVTYFSLILPSPVYSILCFLCQLLFRSHFPSQFFLFHSSLSASFPCSKKFLFLFPCLFSSSVLRVTPTFPPVPLTFFSILFLLPLSFPPTAKFLFPSSLSASSFLPLLLLSHLLSLLLLSSFLSIQLCSAFLFPCLQKSFFLLLCLFLVLFGMSLSLLLSLLPLLLLSQFISSCLLSFLFQLLIHSPVYLSQKSPISFFFAVSGVIPPVLFPSSMPASSLLSLLLLPQLLSFCPSCCLLSFLFYLLIRSPFFQS
jgi:hypothetical protein